jgi:hypothetical protein
VINFGPGRSLGGGQAGCGGFEAVESGGAKEARQADECAGGKKGKGQSSTMR